jgi:hypothetical protein
VLCSLVEVDRRFGGVYLSWRQYETLERRATSTRVHGATSQRAIIYKEEQLDNLGYYIMRKFTSSKWLQEDGVPKAAAECLALLVRVRGRLS